uniref:Retrotransposon gag domain-containing protein n=1 Tax=Pygocentrus nattereri TaxID=42514 RepID=A0AAR2KX96_PYGNA
FGGGTVTQSTGKSDSTSQNAREDHMIFPHTCQRSQSSLESLTNQQAVQQAQLVQLVDSIKEMTSQLRGMQPTDSTLRTAPVNPVTTPTLTTFPVSKPDKFTGNPDLCRGFLLQCSVFFDNSPVGSDQAKISFVVSRLSEKALEWATASWPAFNGWTYERFLKEFKLVFDHPYEGKVSGELLTQLRQGPRSVVEYALEFRTLAASSGGCRFSTNRLWSRGELHTCSDSGEATHPCQEPPEFIRSYCIRWRSCGISANHPCHHPY